MSAKDDAPGALGARRLFWATSHQTLVRNEVPLLESAGLVVVTEEPDVASLRFLDALEIVDISNNLGDAKTIATHPATTTHQRLPQDQKDLLGITPGLIRLSVGLEDTRDLIADLRAALDAIAA